MLGVGVAALVIAIVAIFVPIVGPLLTYISAILVLFSYGAGFQWAVAAVIVNIVNVAFLSPSVYGLAGLETLLSGSLDNALAAIIATGSIFIVPQIAALAIAALVTLATRRPAPRDDPPIERYVRCPLCGATMRASARRCPDCDITRAEAAEFLRNKNPRQLK